MFDKVPSLDTHKIGVLYGKSSTTDYGATMAEGADGGSNNLYNYPPAPNGAGSKMPSFFQERFGSARYTRFLESLGSMVRIADYGDECT